MALLLGPEETSPMAGPMLLGALAGEDGGLAGGPSRLPWAQAVVGKNKARPMLVETLFMSLSPALLTGSADDWNCFMPQFPHPFNEVMTNLPGVALRI